MSENIPTIKIDSNRLILSDEAIKMLEANYGDRISVNYIQDDNHNFYPVIGKSSVFSDSNDGNKLTKSKTISFKGIKKNMLSRYGILFLMIEYAPKIFLLKSIN